MIIGSIEFSVSGRFPRIARLRHEGCDFLTDPRTVIEQMKHERPRADLLTFLQELYDPAAALEYHQEPWAASVLTFTTYDEWLTGLGFKARNKVRKALKSGMEIRICTLDDDFARGVEGIYNETPIRQGRKFYHYGKSAEAIKEELGSFLDRSTLVGAFFKGEMIGFMKLFEGRGVLQTIHILAKNSHRDKAVMDGLIAKAIMLCEEKKITHLQYGSWTDGGIGTFRSKLGFERVDYRRYFVPLNLRGRVFLALSLHRPLRELLPERWVLWLKGVRNKLLSRRTEAAPAAQE